MSEDGKPKSGRREDLQKEQIFVDLIKEKEEAMNLNELRQQYRLALLNQDVNRLVKLENAFYDAGGSPRDVVMQKEWANNAKPLIEKAKQLKEANCSMSSLEFDQLDQQAYAYDPLLSEYIRGLMRGNVPAANTSSKAGSQPKGKPPKNPAASKPKPIVKPNSAAPLKTPSLLRSILQVKASKFPKTSVEHYLVKILQAAMNGPKDEDSLISLVTEATELFPNEIEKINYCIEVGNTFYELKNEAWEIAQEGESVKRLNALYNKIDDVAGERNNYLRSQILSAYNRGIAVKQWEQYRTLKFSDIHPNFLLNLPPSDKWTVLIDEAGDMFKANAEDNISSIRGRLAAIIVPDYCHLPDLSDNFHATDENIAKVENVMKRITSSQCGVLGISVDAIHSLDSELWYVGVETLIDLILRLLPIESKTKVEVLVEQRTEFEPKDSKFLNTSCALSLSRLSRICPYRAELISVSGKIIEKDDHPWNGYADTVAFCWGGPTAARLLKQSGWINSCLLDFSPEMLCQAVDSILRQTPLNEQEWDDLINGCESGDSNTLVTELLTIQGQEAAANQTVWNNYLECVQKHLYSKAIDMDKLGKQIAWLKKWLPANVDLSPHIRLIWLTTQLAHANHLGKTDLFTKYQKVFTDLCDLVYPEDAALTCLTCLHVAVAYMNDFNFITAYDAVEYWVDMDEAIPGRLYYGQILSTMGQLYAFTGMQKEAVEACQAAIERFEKLTNADLKTGNINQTSSYKVIAMMDSNPVPDNMTAELEKYLGRTLEEAAEHFAVSAIDKEFYMHHIFLRYLVHVNKPELKPIIERYLSHKAEWKTERHHPWEMILFYRALLQSDIAARKAYLDQAYKQVAQADDGTLKAIACVILGGLYYYDSSRKEELAELTQTVIDKLPYLGEERVTALKNQLEKPIEPLALAKAVLPFNFR